MMMNRFYLLNRVNRIDYPPAQTNTNKTLYILVSDSTIPFRCNSRESFRYLEQDYHEKRHLHELRAAAIVLDPAFFQGISFPTKSPQTAHSIDRKILFPLGTLRRPQFSLLFI